MSGRLVYLRWRAYIITFMQYDEYQRLIGQATSRLGSSTTILASYNRRESKVHEVL